MHVRWCSLVFSCAAAASLSGSLGAQVTEQERAYKVSGVVIDSAREPLAGVEIVTSARTGEASRLVRTDSLGRFEIGPLQRGQLSLEARRLGYVSRTLQVDVGAAGAATSVEIVLTAAPAELQDVLVTASSQGKLRGFYQRRQQRGTFGHFLDEIEVRRRSPRNASDLFRNVPGVVLSSTPNGGSAIRIRGCQPMVWVDDQRVVGAELDDVIVPSDIAAIEFYASSAGIPAQYLERGNRLCGLILVWTRSG